MGLNNSVSYTSVRTVARKLKRLQTFLTIQFRFKCVSIYILGSQIFFFFLSLFIPFETECALALRGGKERGGGRERGTESRAERIPSRLHAVSTKLDVGLELMNHEIMT